MTAVLSFAGALALLGGLLWLILRRRQPKLAELVVEYKRRTGLPPHLAADSLDAQVERLKKRTPGKTLDWYVARALEELERDNKR